jgi:tetratricopeptide (TPR) repeat protein
MQVSFGDIFQLQDTLVQNLIAALSISLTAREHRLLGRDVPATPKAYEFYLRANELARDAEGWDNAVIRYRQCLDQDPRYAPAWARLGYVYRMMAKYRRENSAVNRTSAIEAFDRALAINPDLPFAHKILAQLDVESGKAPEAMGRLLRQAAQISDPELYAGLCHACRYSGLLDASVAAHQHAVRLDPNTATSVVHTWFQLRNFQRVAEVNRETPYIGALAMAELGRGTEALALLRDIAPKLPVRMRDFMSMATYLIEGGAPEDNSMFEQLVQTFTDPEGMFYATQTLSRLGRRDLAISAFSRAVASGYYCYPAFRSDPWLDPLRGDDRFEGALEDARLRHMVAREVFRDARGEQTLGTSQ